LRVLSVVGNRPQFIKSAPLSVALRERGVDETVVHTGQHYDRELSQLFFRELGLPDPDHALGLRTSDPEAMRAPIAEIVGAERADWVLVYGDTNSTLAGAVAAAEAAVPLAHVEAGLRSGDLSMPEERNRIEVDRLSQLLLTPDERSSRILADEGVSGRREVVGDVMADVSKQLAPIARERSRVLEGLGVEPGAYLVATVHREANVRPERLARIAGGLSRLPEPVLFPAHPRTRAALASNRLLLAPHVRLLDPLGYLDFAALASQARVILTDSGGLQKEAYWYGVPCVTMRPSTEWADTVELGANTLVDDDPDRIVAAVADAHIPDDRPPLYGDGRASGRIAGLLVTLSP
jgi:UDP-N-acetylglucosamine 2-epimerase